MVRQGAYALVRGGSSTSNLSDPIEPQHTKLARCGEVCHLSSGWFDCTEPSLATALQGKQGVQGAYACTQHSTALLQVTRN